MDNMYGICVVDSDAWPAFPKHICNNKPALVCYVRITVIFQVELPERFC